MARGPYSTLVILSVLLVCAAGAWGDVGRAGQSAIPPGQGAGAPGIFAQPFGPNQGGAIPVAPLEPEPGVSPIAPEPFAPEPFQSPSISPGAQQPGQVPPGQAPNERLPQGTSCSSGLGSKLGFLCPEPGTLPGSIPSESNVNMFTGREASPTQPGASGKIPGQAGSPFGDQNAPVTVQPARPQGFMTPQR